MHKTHLLAYLAAAALTAAAGGGPGAALAADKSDATGASMQMQRSMMQDMKPMQSMKPSGDMDRDFAAMMRQHHVAGVRMAQYELDHGKDPKIRDMAQKILDTQKKEIAEFDEWLKAHGASKSGSK